MLETGFEKRSLQKFDCRRAISLAERRTPRGRRRSATVNPEPA